MLIRANVTLPILELSATTTLRRACCRKASVGLGLHLVVRRAALLRGEAVDADEREVEVVVGQHRLGRRADQLERAAHDAADHHQPEAGPAGELGRDVDRVGHEGEAARSRERAGDLQGGACRRSGRRPRRRRPGRPPPRAMRRFSGCAGGLDAGRHPASTSRATAPPWVRTSSWLRLSACRSRRTVAPDTPSALARSLTSTRPALADAIEDRVEPLLLRTPGMLSGK